MVLRGNGNGFHSTAVDTGFGSDSDPTQALSADLDGDGKRDVLVPGGGNYWHRLRHTSSGTYAYNALGVINPAPPGGLIAADIDAMVATISSTSSLRATRSIGAATRR